MSTQATDERNALITAVLGKRCEPPHPRCMTCVAWAMSDELERLERALAETHDAWTAETTKRLQAVHERDCAVEDVARLHAKTTRQRVELRRLNKTLRSMWEGVRFKIHVGAAMRERAKHPDVSPNPSTTGE